MEPTRQDNGIKATKAAKNLFNQRRSILSRKEMNEIRKKLHKKEAFYELLKEKEQNGSLTNREKKVLKNIDKYLKNFKNDLEKLQKYQYNIMTQIVYLMNSMKKTITKQQQSRVLLMVVIYSMKAKEVKVIDQRYMSILT